MTKLVATQEFTDKQGRTHKANETFEVQNDQEAQEYISNGQARKAESQQQGQRSDR